MSGENQSFSYDDIVKMHEYKVVMDLQTYLNDPKLWDTPHKQYGLPIFWELIQDRSTQAGNEITTQSTACLTEILKQPFS